MTRREKIDVVRLAAEVRADVAATAARVARLTPWATRETTDDEVLIPAALLHHMYTAIETALTRLVSGIEGAELQGPDAHRRLLSASALDLPGIRPALLTREQLEPLRELLGFRHLFRQGYAAAYRPERIRELAAQAITVWPSVEHSLRRAVEFVETLVSE